MFSDVCREMMNYQTSLYVLDDDARPVSVELRTDTCTARTPFDDRFLFKRTEGGGEVSLLRVLTYKRVMVSTTVLKRRTPVE
jgi:hypothetical protein